MHGATPLHIASENGSLPVITHLVEHGADVNAVDNIGASVLHYIVDNSDSENPSHEKCLRYLLKKNDIDITVCNSLEATPLHLAIVRK